MKIILRLITFLLVISWVVCCIDIFSLIFSRFNAWYSMRLLISHFFHCELVFLVIFDLSFSIDTFWFIRINIIWRFFTIKLIFLLASYLYLFTKTFLLNFLFNMITGCFYDDFHWFIAFIQYLFWFFIAFI